MSDLDDEIELLAEAFANDEIDLPDECEVHGVVDCDICGGLDEVAR